MRVLITGCSTGIGRAAARELHARGHDVVATARRTEALEDLGAALALPLDVTEPESIRSAVRQAGNLDALVNNAGIAVYGPLESIPLEDVRRTFETNTFGALAMMQAVVPTFRQRRSGVVVNVSSVAGRFAPALSGIYSASKFALEAMSEALRAEVRRFGVRVHLIEPGVVSSHIQSSMQVVGGDKDYEELLAQWHRIEDAMTAAAPAAELVASAIADTIEDPSAPFRQPVGPDAEASLAARSAMDDETFESTMRAATGFTW
ncbi:MAG: SDR family oxidoreductase [Acidimicrobiales bacterium]